MDLRSRRLVRPKLVRVVAAVVIGLGVGTILSPGAVSLPVLGVVPGLVLGGVGLVAGAAAYQWAPRLVATSECGCAGECGCS